MSSSASNTVSLIGSLAGDYQLEELLRERNRYSVFRATHSKLDRQAAVTVYDAGFCDAAMRERIEGQARLSSRVRHRNVIELYDYGVREDGLVYVTREWVGGKRLTTVVESLTHEPLRTLLNELCEGLGAIHKAGLVHGELSRATVTLEEDSGIVKLKGGALDLAAKEHSSAGQQADIVALGTIIHELFCLPSASAATEHEDALVPHGIEAIIDKCQAAEPGQGYATVDEVAEALEEALGGKASHDDELEPGTLIGDTYRVYAVIGSGGMGKVYEAVHKRLPQRVAIKVISGEYREESLIRFRQEAEIASSVGHPHIVRVFDFNTLPDGRPYMVMEFLQGEDLARALSRGPLPAAKALLIAGQVGSALSAAHAQGIVHRDLKPPNIFLGSVEIGGEHREHATVLDFGVSKKEDSESSITQTEAIIGTPRYMAPEQAMGKHDLVGPLSDQFALACIVYEMLSGRRCFAGKDLHEIVHSVCYVEPRSLGAIVPGLDPAIVAAVERGMHKEPEERFSSMADFVAALKGIEPGTSRDSNLAPEAMPTPMPRDDSSTAETLATVASRPASRPASVPEVAKPKESAKEDPSKIATVDVSEDGPVPTDKETRRWRKGMVLVGITAVAGVVYLTWPFGGDSKTRTLEGPVAIIEPSVGAAAAPPPDANTVPKTLATDSVIVDASPLEDASPAEPKGDARRRHRGPRHHGDRHSNLDAETEAHLDAAENLVRAGRSREARQSLGSHPAAARSNRGYAITVMSYCSESNFGAATDWFARVRRGERRRVRRYCKTTHDIDLD